LRCQDAYSEPAALHVHNGATVKPRAGPSSSSGRCSHRRAQHYCSLFSLSLLPIIDLKHPTVAHSLFSLLSTRRRPPPPPVPSYRSARVLHVASSKHRFRAGSSIILHLSLGILGIKTYHLWSLNGEGHAPFPVRRTPPIVPALSGPAPDVEADLLLVLSLLHVCASPRVGRSRMRSTRTFLPWPSTRGETRPSCRRTTSARP
jgi:hypothetical protein